MNKNKGSQIIQLKSNQSKKNKSLITLFIIIEIIILILAIVLFFWISSFEDSESSHPWMKVSIEEKDEYWSISPFLFEGGPYKLDDIKFELYNKKNIQIFSKSITDANPNYIEINYSRIYPIPSNSHSVFENSSIGDGQIIDSESVNKPQIWEGCYFAYIDIESDNKITSGDVIWIFKDHNNDNIDDIDIGYIFKILDKKNREVLIEDI